MIFCRPEFLCLPLDTIYHFQLQSADSDCCTICRNSSLLNYYWNNLVNRNFLFFLYKYHYHIENRVLISCRAKFLPLQLHTYVINHFEPQSVDIDPCTIVVIKQLTGNKNIQNNNTNKHLSIIIHFNHFHSFLFHVSHFKISPAISPQIYIGTVTKLPKLLLKIKQFLIRKSW